MTRDAWIAVAHLPGLQLVTALCIGASAGEAEETLRGQLRALAGGHEPRESIAVALLTRSGIGELERVTGVPAVEIRKRLLDLSV